MADIKEDIDTLLVFVSSLFDPTNIEANLQQAGLFSAVITAFLIESYKNLQQQPEDMTNQILLQLSTQITSFTMNRDCISSVTSDFTSSPFQRPQYAVPINILWFLSLVISLITASLGILVKQWFHELLSYETHDPKERLKLRFFREAGLERWKVFAIASSLPLLLQLALSLFFVGLSLFLLQQDPIVAWVTTGMMISWLMLFLFTMFVPMFSSQCPYKIPMLKKLLHWLRWTSISKSYRFFDRLQGDSSRGSVVKCIWRTFKKWLGSLVDVRRPFEEHIVSKDVSLDIPVVLYTKDVLRGERLNDSIVECFRSITDQDVEKTVTDILDEGSTINNGILPSIFDGVTQSVKKFLLEITEDNYLLSFYFGPESDLSVWSVLHSAFVHMSTKTYNPGNDVISSQSLSPFIRLLQAEPTSATFSLLTMYSIRHRTLIDHPSTFDVLFTGICDIEKQSYGIGNITIC